MHKHVHIYDICMHILYAYIYISCMCKCTASLQENVQYGSLSIYMFIHVDMIVCMFV